MALGSSCSSSFNFSADFRNVCMGFVTGHGYEKCEHKLRRTATSATNTAQSLDTSMFSLVAVPLRAATYTATNCYKNTKEGR